MSFNREPLTQDEQTALDIIRGHRAIVSMHADLSFNEDKTSFIYDHADADDLVNQLFDPNQYRPSRSAALFASKNLPRPATLFKTDLRTGEKYQYTPGVCRYTKHKGMNFQFTAKTPTSLLPPEPEYMSVFGDDYIGYGWDIDTCDLKGERYVWETDGASDCSFWLTPNPYDAVIQANDIYLPAVPVSRLKENNLQAIRDKKNIWLNELDIGLPKRKLDFMFCARDKLDSRLRVWNQMLRDKKRLQFEKDVPLFIIQSDRQDGLGSEFRVYGAAERLEDLKAANAILQNPPADMMEPQLTLLRTCVAELNVLLGLAPVIQKNEMVQDKKYHPMLFKSVAKDEKSELKSIIKSEMNQVKSEIDSWWFYPNKDRKRMKFAAYKKMNTLLSSPVELLTYIAELEKEQSPVLQGVFSTRFRDCAEKAKKWAQKQLSEQAAESNVARVLP